MVDHAKVDEIQRCLEGYRAAKNALGCSGLTRENRLDDGPLFDRAEEYIAFLLDVVYQLTTRPKIITLCGSTRFTAQMLDEAWRLTKEGNIVIHWSILNGKEALAHGAEREGGEALKKRIDALYLHKIALADEVRVINIGGYVGQSTKTEIEHAISLGKCVTWLEVCESCPGRPLDHPGQCIGMDGQ